MRFVSALLLSLLACLIATGTFCDRAQATDAILGPEAAKTIPIADAHFHVMTWMDVRELIGYMDRNGIRWAGGGGIAGGSGEPELVRAKHAEAITLLGNRYIRVTGMGYWFRLKREEGVAALEKLDTPAFEKILAAIEADLRDRDARVIGELHVNAMTSANHPFGQFKIKGDAPTLKALLDLAGKYNRPLSIHAQWDPDTAEEVGRLAESNRTARLILAHCGTFATSAEIRALFERHPNVSCDLAYRSAPPLKHRGRRRAIFDDGGIQGDWKQLIEDYPDRFVVGIDDMYSWSEYEEVAQVIRFGLLENLSPATAEKVAYKNAVAWFELE